MGAHAVSTLGGSRSRVQRDRLGPGPSADAGPPQASMPPLQHIRFSPDWHAAQPQRAIVSCDTINRAHVRGRATQSGSARTWRLQGSSEGWYRRSAARKGRAVESSWRQRCRTWPDHVGAVALAIVVSALVDATAVASHLPSSGLLIRPCTPLSLESGYEDRVQIQI